MALNFTNTAGSGSITNSSIPDVDYVQVICNWLLVPLSICGTILNLTAIVAFISNRKLWTPFNCYLCHLAFCDLILASLDTIFYFINNLPGNWTFGRATCHFWLYIDWTVTIAVAYSLMLISVDRLFAISFPVEYRATQSKRHSMFAITLIWVLINTFILPGFTIEREHEVDGSECYQDLGSYKAWTLTSQLMGYYLPHACVIVANIGIGVQLWRKMTVGVPGKKSNLPRNQVSVAAPVPPIATGNTQKIHQPGSTSFSHDIGGKSCVIGLVKPCQDQGHGRRSREDSLLPQVPKHRPGSTDRMPLRLLAELVLCFTICWTPSYVYFSLVTFYPNYQSNMFVALSQLLSFMNYICNPILYHIGGNNDYRKAIRHLYSTWIHGFKCLSCKMQHRRPTLKVISATVPSGASKD